MSDFDSVGNPTSKYMTIAGPRAFPVSGQETLDYERWKQDQESIAMEAVLDKFGKNEHGHKAAMQEYNRWYGGLEGQQPRNWQQAMSILPQSQYAMEGIRGAMASAPEAGPGYDISQAPGWIQKGVEQAGLPQWMQEGIAESERNPVEIGAPPPRDPRPAVAERTLRPQFGALQSEDMPTRKRDPFTPPPGAPQVPAQEEGTPSWIQEGIANVPPEGTPDAFDPSPPPRDPMLAPLPGGGRPQFESAWDAPPQAPAPQADQQPAWLQQGLKQEPLSMEEATRPTLRQYTQTFQREPMMFTPGDEVSLPQQIVRPQGYHEFMTMDAEDFDTENPVKGTDVANEARRSPQMDTVPLTLLEEMADRESTPDYYHPLRGDVQGPGMGDLGFPQPMDFSGMGAGIPPMNVSGPPVGQPPAHVGPRAGRFEFPQGGMGPLGALQRRGEERKAAAKKFQSMATKFNNQKP